MLRRRCQRLRKIKEDNCNGAAGCVSHMCCDELAERLHKGEECLRLRRRITTDCFAGVVDPVHLMEEGAVQAGVDPCIAVMDWKCVNQPQVIFS